MLYYWPWFPGMFYQHVSSSYLKSTYETVWEEEFETLNETCMHKFRQMGDVNQWVMKFWQLASGQFNVRPRSFAHCYHVKKSTFKPMCRDLKNQTHAMICINDNARTFHFEAKKERVIALMDANLPEKSFFEK